MHRLEKSEVEPFGWYSKHTYCKKLKSVSSSFLYNAFMEINGIWNLDIPKILLGLCNSKEKLFTRHINFTNLSELNPEPSSILHIQTMTSVIINLETLEIMTGHWCMYESYLDTLKLGKNNFGQEHAILSAPVKHINDIKNLDKNLKIHRSQKKHKKIIYWRKTQDMIVA